jgi:hypothetical protein
MTDLSPTPKPGEIVIENKFEHTPGQNTQEMREIFATWKPSRANYQKIIAINGMAPVSDAARRQNNTWEHMRFVDNASKIERDVKDLVDSSNAYKRLLQSFAEIKYLPKESYEKNANIIRESVQVQDADAHENLQKLMKQLVKNENKAYQTSQRMGEDPWSYSLVGVNGQRESPWEQKLDRLKILIQEYYSRLAKSRPVSLDLV